MVSPVVRKMNNAYDKIKEGMPVIIFVLTIFTALSLSAGQGVVKSMVELGIQDHESSANVHPGIVALKTNQAVLITKLEVNEQALDNNSEKMEELSRQLLSSRLENQSLTEKLNLLLQRTPKI